jgi:uncharacterized protein (DUF2062 family)
VRSRIRRAFQAFLHLDDTPRRIALAFGIGVYIAFHPLFGLHTVMALLIAFAFGLSRAAIIAGIYVNNPWTMAPMYIAGTSLGCLILGVPMDALGEIEWDLDNREFYHLLIVSLRPYLWPFVVGNTLLGVACGVTAYFTLRWALERRARRLSRGPEPADGGP